MLITLLPAAAVWIVALCCPQLSSAFIFLPYDGTSSPRKGILSVRSSTTDDDFMVDLRSQSVRELKKELRDRQIPTNDLFEKEDLVQRLFEATQSNGGSKEYTVANPPNTNDPTSPSSSSSSSSVGIVAPLKLSALRDNVVVDSSSSVNGNFNFSPTDQPFATMELEISSGKYTLNLMVDTACSGVVLKSSAVQKYNLPRLKTPVTSTGASGTAENTGLTEIPNFVVGGETFNRLPAAVQDIDSLPDSIDGIIGLSFLGQFHTVEFDYESELLRLYKEAPPPSPSTVTTQGSLKMLGSMGIYSVDVFFGGRGPVSMIVDTGGSNTFLSWKGVSDLGLDRNSKAVSRISQPMGAMGHTSQVFELTHRIYVSSQLQLGNRASTLPGLSLAGDARLGIDIGEIPLLQMMANQGIGGILGLDVFTRCKAIRVQLQGTQRTVTLLS